MSFMFNKAISFNKNISTKMIIKPDDSSYTA
ncbi:hypothetical protein JIY74_30165 [Vibrio harveyi]|nr:hypothetical protein [Vibrio harveyi]